MFSHKQIDMIAIEFINKNKDHLNWMQNRIDDCAEFIQIELNSNAILKRLAANIDTFIEYVEHFSISPCELTQLIGNTPKDVTLYCIEKTKDYNEDPARQLEINCIKAIINDDYESYKEYHSQLSLIYQHLTERCIISQQLHTNMIYARMKSVELEDEYFARIAEYYERKDIVQKIRSYRYNSDSSSGSNYHQCPGKCQCEERDREYTCQGIELNKDAMYDAASTFYTFHCKRCAMRGCPYLSYCH
jgi:hypothetical protein